MNDDHRKFLEYLQKERDKIRSVRFEMNKDLVEKRIMNINQRREFFQHITILALGLCGVTFFTEKILHKTDFVIGFFLLILVVLFILTWLRETLDKESINLEKLQDKYNNATDEKDHLIETYADKVYDKDLLSRFIEEVNSSPNAVLLKKDVAEQAEQRNNKHKKQLDYFGEVVVCVFALGILFLFLSAIEWVPNPYLLGFVVMLICSLSLQDFFLKKSGFVSRIISLLHTDIKKIGK